MATGGTPTESLASIKRNLDEISCQIFEIDIKIQDFKKSGKDIADLEEAKRLLQQDIVDLQIKFKLQKARNKKKRN